MTIRPVVDPAPLMIAIAKMANMEPARIRRMVLVLDMDDVPRLYTESYLVNDSAAHELPETKLQVHEDTPVIVDPDKCKVEVLQATCSCQASKIIGDREWKCGLDAGHTGPHKSGFGEWSDLIIDTTTMRNENWRTLVPKPQS